MYCCSFHFQITAKVMEALEAAVANIHLDEDDGVFSPRDYQVLSFDVLMQLSQWHTLLAI
jgi:hypothetical protein